MIISIIEKRCFAAVTHGGDSGGSYLLAGLRVSEVNCGDLKDNTLTIRQSKTDQFGEGRVLFVGDETVQVIKELKAKANISRGALFRRVLKNGKTPVTRLTPEAVREIVKKRSQGIQGVQGRVLGHSLRVGSTVSLARGNASMVDGRILGCRPIMRAR